MRRQLSVLCSVAAVGLGLMASPAGAAPQRQSTTATFTGGPDTVTTFRCEPADAIATCHGTAGGNAVYSGDWTGTSHYDYRFVITATGSYSVDITERFEGSVNGCGQGTFVVRTHESIEPTGVARGRWVIAPQGTGDFSDLAGAGSSAAVYAVDGTGAGTITGAVICRP